MRSKFQRGDGSRAGDVIRAHFATTAASPTLVTTRSRASTVKLAPIFPPGYRLSWYARTIDRRLAITAVPIFSTLAIEANEGVAEIRFTRPDLLNRFDALAHDDFIGALAHVRLAVAGLRVLIISAEGRVFSAGGDFDEILEGHASAAVRERMTSHARGVLLGLIDFPVPVISAVQGAAIGLGATIAGIADIVVAWRGAKIADTHVNVGIVAGDGGIVAWSQSVGVNRAKRYLLTGDIISGQQAYDFGFVTDLAENPEDVLPAARAIAQRICSLPPEGVNGTKRAFTAVSRARASESFELGISLEMHSMAAASLPETVARLRKR